MAFKLVAFAALLAVANGGHLYGQHQYAQAYVASPVTTLHSAPVLASTKIVDSEYDHHPEYSFSYGVQDGHTGDSKSQQESRHGDVVEGSYSLVDPDGTKRTVSYHADDVNGFNAVVDKQPAVHALKQVVQPVVHVESAPVIQKYHHVEPAVQSSSAVVHSHVETSPVVQQYHHVQPVVQQYHHVEPVVQQYHHVEPVVQQYHHVEPVVHHQYQAHPVAYTSYGTPYVSKYSSW